MRGCSVEGVGISGGDLVAHLLVATGTTWAGWADGSHELAGAGRSVRARGSVWSSWAVRSIGAIGSGWSSRANNTFGACGSSWTSRAGGTIRTVGALRTLGTFRAIRAGGAVGALRALRTLGTLRAIRAGGAVGAIRAIRTIRTVGAGGASWTSDTIGTLGAGGSSRTVRLDNIDGFEIEFRGRLVLEALLVEIFSVLKLDRFDNTLEESVELGVSLNGVDFALSSVEDSLELVGRVLELIGGSLDVEWQVGIDDDLVDIGSTEGSTDDAVDNISHDVLVGDLGDN